MSVRFDPYHKWLGIPQEEQPPHHYRLLGVQLFESDTDVINNASDQRMGLLKTFAAGAHGTLAEELLNQVARARICLLNPEKKLAYDRALRGESGSAAETGKIREGFWLPPPTGTALALDVTCPHCESSAMYDLAAIRRRVPCNVCNKEMMLPGLKEVATARPKQKPTPPPTNHAINGPDGPIHALETSNTQQDSFLQDKWSIIASKTSRPKKRRHPALTLLLIVLGGLAGLGLGLYVLFIANPNNPIFSGAKNVAQERADGSTNHDNFKTRRPSPSKVSRVPKVASDLDNRGIDERSEKDLARQLARDRGVELPKIVVPPPSEPIKPIEPSIVPPEPIKEALPQKPPRITVLLTGRELVKKESLLKESGGTLKTEAAVAQGLRWLSSQQTRNGLWSLRGPYSDGSTVENAQAATAMALLAYQGAGYTNKANHSAAFTSSIRRGWAALEKQMDFDGRFFNETNKLPEQQLLYTQALCTIALCELYGMTHDEKYAEGAQHAVEYCISIQSPEGGWRYTPGTDSDLSVTGWFVMALQSARMAGIEVPEQTFARISKFLDTVARDKGSRYSYQSNAGATVALSAEGLLCRQYLGWSHDDQRLNTGVVYLLANKPNWGERNVYYWYDATQVLRHMGGEPWEKWNETMRDMLPGHQERQGKEHGSWDPTGDRWGKTAGRLYVTCMSLYILEAYYRHLPLYE